MTSKPKFIRYLGNAHINNMNLDLYDNGVVRHENVITDRHVAARKFADVAAAEAWFESLGSNNLQRTLVAMEQL